MCSSVRNPDREAAVAWHGCYRLRANSLLPQELPESQQRVLWAARFLVLRPRLRCPMAQFSGQLRSQCQRLVSWRRVGRCWLQRVAVEYGGGGTSVAGDLVLLAARRCFLPRRLGSWCGDGPVSQSWLRKSWLSAKHVHYSRWAAWCH